MLDAGKYFLYKQKRSLGVSEEELIRIAILSLGLSELAPFKPAERIIEYLLEEHHDSRLAGLSLKSFANETASESPAPGGGSVSAYAAALGASLGTMVANLSAHKKGWDDRWEEFSKWAEKGQRYKVELLKLVDEDSKAFEEVMAAWKLPKESQADLEERAAAINRATIKAIDVPYKVMKISLDAMELIRYTAQNGLSSSISDAGVGALMANAAVKGAYFNVRINCKSLQNPGYVAKILKDAAAIAGKAGEMENEILEIVEKKLSQVSHDK
jgi:glutamate formiminotransferase/formiminotetrahydrofolate cyclodeaminase